MKKTLIFTLLAFIMLVTTPALAKNRSQLLSERLMSEVTYGSVYLQGPTLIWDEGEFQNGIFTITGDSSSIKTGRYVIKFWGYNKDGQARVMAVSENRLHSGENIIDLKYVAVTHIGYTLNLETIPQNAEAKVSITEANSDGSGGYSTFNIPITITDQGAMIDLWFEPNTDKIEIKVDGIYYIINHPVDQFIDNGSIKVSEIEQTASYGIDLEAYTGLVYPIDFKGTLEEAIDSLSDGNTLRIAPGTYYLREMRADKSITIIGDPSFGTHIVSWSGTTTKIINDDAYHNACITFRYLRFSSYDYSQAGAVIDKTAANVIFDHCVFLTTGNTGILGEDRGLMLKHCTILGDIYENCENDGTALSTNSNFGESNIEDSMFVNFDNLTSDSAAINGKNNLIWNVKNADLANNLENTVYADPLLLWEDGPPSIDSPANGGTSDGTYIGARVPRIN